MVDSSYVQVGPQVEAAIRDWDQGGRAKVQALLRTSEGSSLLTTLPSHLALLTLLQSSTPTVEQISELLKEAIAEDEDLLETILDVTETIEQELEDTKDLVRDAGESESVDATPQPASSGKAMEVVKALLKSGVMPSHLPSLLLSLSHFPALGLTNPGQPVQTLTRLHTRRYTNAVIRQLKHNLLRESSEGFSALIIVLTDHDAHGRSAAETWRKAQSIMGYFNLAPVRVLDVIFDVFECSFEQEWVYWLDVLKCTPWGKDAGWTGGKGKGRAETEEVAQLDTDKIEPFILAERGDRVLAEVLGFKFADYQRDENEETTPMSLIYVAALLVKEGFVRSLDLLPFLTPDEKQLSAIATKYTDDIRAKAGSGASNALANAAALTEEPDTPAGAPAAGSTPTALTVAPVAPVKPKQIPEQRIQLLQAFLGLGYIPGAYFILASSPSLAQSHPAVSDHLLRLMTHAIEPVYQVTVRDAQDDGEWDFTMPKSTSAFKPRLTPTHILPLPPATRLEQFEYFYPSWSEGLQSWSTPEEMWSRGSKLFKLVGGMGSRDVVLATKVCRIAVACFARFRSEKEQQLGLPGPEHTNLIAEKLEAPVPTFTPRSLETERLLIPTEKEMAPWLLMLRAFLLPSMTLSESNSAYAREIWDLLRYFPYSVRYSLYGEWRDVIASTTNGRSMSAMTLGAYDAERTTKMAMRKLTKTDFKMSGRILAKVAQSNPCAMWRVIMDQVKAYAITAQIVPDAMRYMPLIAYDVIIFAVLDEMATPPKTQAQAEAKISHVQNLSKFLGEVCRRHTSIDMDPIIQFIVNRLQSRMPNDLVVLGTLITIMTGDEILGNSSISEAQFAALAGGPELVREGLYETRESFSKPVIVSESVAVRDAGAQVKVAAPTKKSKQRLVDALRATGLAVPIWIALAQARQGCLAQMGDFPAKAMAKGFDDAHDIFLQYSALLADQFTGEEHIKLMPPLDELVRDYHLEEAVAFHMLRRKLTEEMKRAHKVEVEALQRKLNAEKAEAERVKGENEEPAPEVAEAEAALAKRKRQWWPAALHEVMLESKEILPMDVARNQTVLPCPFYAFFWQMSLMDLDVPIASYDAAITRLQKTAREIKTWRALSGRGPKQADITREAKRFDDRAAELLKEREMQMSTVSGLYRKSLRQRSAKWFEGYGANLVDQRRLSRELYQRCFFPRAIVSPADAAYVAKMIARLHEYGCQGFSVLYAYDHFFSEQLAAAIYVCTDDEARNFGRCLAVILAELNKWHKDEKLFNEGALGIGKSRDKPTEPTLPGFQLRSKATDGTDQISHMSWSDFRRWMLKVHKNLAQAISSCLKQGDYRHVFNGITVAQRVLDHFPLEAQNGKDVLQALSTYTGTRLQADGSLKAIDENSNVREDIQNLANSYQSQLIQKRQARPWLSQAAFCPPLARRADKVTPDVPPTPATPITPATPALPSTMDVDVKPTTNGLPQRPAAPTGPSASRLPTTPSRDSPATNGDRARDLRPSGGDGRATPVAPLRRGLPPHISSPATGHSRPANGDKESTEDAQQRLMEARARKFQSPVTSAPPSRDVTPPSIRLPPREPSRRRRSTSVESRLSERSKPKEGREEAPRSDRHREERRREHRSSRHGDDERKDPPTGPSESGRSKRSESGRERERERDERRSKDKDRPKETDAEREARRERRKADDKEREKRRKEEGREPRDKDKDKDKERREHRSDREHRSRKDDSDRSKREDSKSQRHREEPARSGVNDIPVGPRASSSQSSGPAPAATPQATIPSVSSNGLPARPSSSTPKAPATAVPQPMAPPPVPSQQSAPPTARTQPTGPRAESAASARPDKRPIEDVAAPEAPEAKKGPAVKIDRNRGRRTGGPSSLMSAMAGAVRSVENRDRK